MMALCYLDRTFCCSPDCENKCGRKPSEDLEARAESFGLPVAYSYFCGGEPEINTTNPTT